MTRSNHAGAQGAYGDRLGAAFRQKDPPTLTSQTLRKNRLAVTEVRCDRSNFGLTEPIPCEDAYLVALQVCQVPDHELWVDGRPARATPFGAGQTSIYDLNRNPVAYIGCPFHSLHFYVPRAALNEIADEAGAARIEDLHYTPGVGVDDEIMRHLVACLLPAIERPDQVSALFVDHIALALCAHVAQTYGGMRPAPMPTRGGLAPWQERRAKEIMSAELERDVSLDRLAAECQLSRTHFARAFRQTTGMPPHRWLLARRVEKAKDLLSRSRSSLAEIALACGFADQSHFTKVFTRMVGTSPGAWRRAHLTYTVPGKGPIMQPAPPDPMDDPAQYLIAHRLRKWGGGA
jgi:AraC family transcriptional regulator